MGNKQCGACGAPYSQADNSLVRTLSHHCALFSLCPAQVKFDDQPDSWQCPKCQAPKSGFIDVDANGASAPAPAPAPAKHEDQLPEPEKPEDRPQAPAPIRERVTMKELTKENPWVKYTEGRKLGGGAFGAVHQAVCKATGEKVAIKSIVGSKMTDKMKKREIDTMLNCHCKYLIETHAAMEWRGTLYIVMDLVEARTDDIHFDARGAGCGGNPDIFAWLTEDHGIGSRDPTTQESATIIHHIAAAVQYLNAPPLFAIHRCCCSSVRVS